MDSVSYITSTTLDEKSPSSLIAVDEMLTLYLNFLNNASFLVGSKWHTQPKEKPIISQPLFSIKIPAPGTAFQYKTPAPGLKKLNKIPTPGHNLPTQMSRYQ